MPVLMFYDVLHNFFLSLKFGTNLVTPFIFIFSAKNGKSE